MQGQLIRNLCVYSFDEACVFIYLMSEIPPTSRPIGINSGEL